MSDLFLRTARGETVERTPIWIMRQAGRYLAEYREVRERVAFHTLCKSPELAAEVTLQPIRRFGFDAAILFSDIMIPAEPMGVEVAFNPGPVIDEPLRDRAAIERLRLVDPRDEVGFVYDTIRILRRELPAGTTLIGFGAAPFTLAAYLVEGRGSKQFDQVRRLLLGDRSSAHLLLERVTEATSRYLVAQVEAGAQAVQLFDTWAGLLSRETYREFGLRYVNQVLEALGSSGVPLIYFALNAGHLLSEIAECPANVIGADWRLPLDEVSEGLGGRFVLQGNLDPCALLAPQQEMERQAQEVLRVAAGLPGHIFNLGHGILPDTPVENVQALVEVVRRASVRNR